MYNTYVRGYVRTYVRTYIHKYEPNLILKSPAYICNYVATYNS